MLESPLNILVAVYQVRPHESTPKAPGAINIPMGEFIRDCDKEKGSNPNLDEIRDSDVSN